MGEPIFFIVKLGQQRFKQLLQLMPLLYYCLLHNLASLNRFGSQTVYFIDHLLINTYNKPNIFLGGTENVKYNHKREDRQSVRQTDRRRDSLLNIPERKRKNNKTKNV